MENKEIENIKPILHTKEVLFEDDFEIEYQVLPAFSPEEIQKKDIAEKIAKIDAISEEIEEKISNLNINIGSVQITGSEIRPNYV